MIDANGSRFALLLGPDDWGRCLLDAEGQPPLGALWADELARDSSPLQYDRDAQSLMLTRRLGRFRAGRGDVPPAAARRLGAAMDRHGNAYAIVDEGRRIDVRSAGSGRISVYWPQAAEVPAAQPGAFAPVAPAAAPPAPRLRGLAVTTGGYLVAGRRPAEGATGGLLVFDLLAGGPPLQLDWPAAWTLDPLDMAPRRGGGLALLEGSGRRVWMLDRRFAMEASFLVMPTAHSGFGPVDGSSPAPAAPAAQPWFDIAATLPPALAIEVLPDGAVLLLHEAGDARFSTLTLHVNGVQAGRDSTEAALPVIAPGDRAGFVLRGFDFGWQAGRADGAPRIVVVGDDGNQAIAFDVLRPGGALALDPDPGFLPLRRYGGLNLAGRGVVQASGDTGLFYESAGRWLPLVEQRRPRYQPAAALLSPAFDGQEPGSTWHRVMLDACIPPGCTVRVASRAADDAALLQDMPFTDEPAPLLRPDGSELPWLIDAPVLGTDPTHGHGTWELLLQRARGRWLQLRLSLEGNELATPRVAALRAWRPRFSYLHRYLPAVYRDDAASADFLERFLALFEGGFTTLEDRIASASALFDVRSAPAETLDWLAAWLGLVLDPAFDEDRRRRLIRHAVPMFAYRGTAQALRLAVQLALSDCVPEDEFELPQPSQQPWGVRIVERFLLRSRPPALLGETTFDSGLRTVVTSGLWTPAEGAEGLHRRWRDWLATAKLPDAAATFRPLPPADAAQATQWPAFCSATLGAVPQLAQRFDAAWKAWAARGADAGLGPEVPQRWPQDTDTDAEARRKAWRDFIAALAPDLRRWLRRWQGYLARRYLRPAACRSATGFDWPEFELMPVPTWLPSATAFLADWATFEQRLEPMAAEAHAFSVLLPISGPQADAAKVAQQVDLARRVTELARPAHTRFDVRPYWALFRIGQVRLGLDTLLGLGSREPGLAPPLVLGEGHVGAARVALAPCVPPDRTVLAC